MKRRTLSLIGIGCAIVLFSLILIFNIFILIAIIFFNPSPQSTASLQSVPSRNIDQLYINIIRDSFANDILFSNSNTPPRINKDTIFSKPGEKLLNCQDLRHVQMTDFSSGWSKSVYSTTINDNPIIIKQIHRDGEHFQKCMRINQDIGICVNELEKKLFKEMALLKILHGPNIIQKLGQCFDDGENVAIVTERGSEIDMISTIQMSWENRLRMAYDFAKLLVHMNNLPGLMASSGTTTAAAMNDLRREQFVLVNGVLKLVDLDDVHIGDPLCHIDIDCQQFLPKNTSITRNFKVQCVNNRCKGVNDMINVRRGGEHLIPFLLDPGSPPLLKPLVNELTQYYTDSLAPSNKIYQLTKRIVSLFQSGRYLPRPTPAHWQTSFQRIADTDLPGIGDFSCAMSTSNICTISVYDRREAEDFCNAEPKCRSFVITNSTTWTGRRIAVLKNATSGQIESIGNQLFLK